jgi:hypothetical protein
VGGFDASPKIEAIEKDWVISAKFTVVVNQAKDRLRISCDELQLRNPKINSKIQIPTAEITFVNYDRLSNTLCLRHINPAGATILSYWGLRSIPKEIAEVIRTTEQLVLAGNRIELANEIWENPFHRSVEESDPKTLPDTFDPFEL